MNAVDLSIPVYLNQQVVFDLLAVLDNGFTNLSTVKTVASQSEQNKYGMSGGVGVSNAFALLNVTFGAERNKDKQKQDTTEIVEERIHTPTSLFVRLRNELKNRELLKEVTDAQTLEKLQSGDFVEFEARLRQNPLVKTRLMFRTSEGEREQR
jgi:hypothetical protein